MAYCGSLDSEMELMDISEDTTVDFNMEEGRNASQVQNRESENFHGSGLYFPIPTQMIRILPRAEVSILPVPKLYSVSSAPVPNYQSNPRFTGSVDYNPLFYGLAECSTRYHAQSSESIGIKRGNTNAKVMNMNRLPLIIPIPKKEHVPVPKIENVVAASSSPGSYNHSFHVSVIRVHENIVRPPGSKKMRVDMITRTRHVRTRTIIRNAAASSYPRRFNQSSRLRTATTVGGNIGLKRDIPTTTPSLPSASQENTACNYKAVIYNHIGAAQLIKVSSGVPALTNML